MINNDIGSENCPLLEFEHENDIAFLNEQENKISFIPGKKGPYPKHIFFILGNEFCERYSYYGMRTILILYLKYYLEYDDDSATVIYHTFTVLCYLWPLVGAFIADSWWGKYHTILYLSIWYAIGMYMITLGAWPTIGTLSTHIGLSLTGLFIVAMGTGGIKPCVSSFGGDQFKPNQDKYRRSFFSLFYFAINAGSLVSTFVSPIIRDTPCLGEDNCYALAFGIPACLMVIATVFFVIGTVFYVRNPPEGNIFAELCKGIWSAWKHRWNTPRKQRNKDHWMDYALVDTNPKMVRDIKYVLNVLLLYVPLPVFWALFDQQGSRWTLQATRMNGYVGDVRVKPDQMQVFNPLMIVTLIPLFEATLYPCLRHYNLNFSPLRRMTLGQILAGLAFILAAFCQLAIDETLTIVPDAHDEGSLRVINAADCELIISSDVYEAWNPDTSSIIIDGSSYAGESVESGNSTDTLENFIEPKNLDKEMVLNFKCLENDKSGEVTFTVPGETVQNIVISDDGVDDFKTVQYEGVIIKSVSGGGIITVVNALNYNITVDGLGEAFGVMKNTAAEPVDMERGWYTIIIYDELNNKIFNNSYHLETGAMYSLIIQDINGYGESMEDIVGDFYEDVHQNTVNIFWMLPQYFVITVGEVFLSVTGLEFSYTQAPPSMKAVLTSFWLLTVSIGNIIVLIIAESSWVDSQANEYFLFAVLIFIAALIFVGLALRYTYVDESVFQEQDEDKQILEEHDFNEGYEKKLGYENNTFDFNTEL